MLRLASFAAVATVVSMAAALADLPPPRDDYYGPRQATLGGLSFEHRLTHYSRTLRLHREDSFVMLVGCAGASENCRLVTGSGVVDWDVFSVDGKPVEGGDLSILIDGFSAANRHSKVKLVFQHHGEPARRIELSLAR